MLLCSLTAGQKLYREASVSKSVLVNFTGDSPHDELLEISCRKGGETSWEFVIKCVLQYYTAHFKKSVLPCSQVSVWSKDGILIPNCNAILR